MKDDLIERLRAHADTQIEDELDYVWIADALMHEAADALERLQADHDAVRREGFANGVEAAARICELRAEVNHRGGIPDGGMLNDAFAIRTLIPASQPQDTDTNTEGREHG